jgi:isopenicillin N synthase-like dioxygenase
MREVPIIDVSPLFEDTPSPCKEIVKGEIKAACEHSGFFYIKNSNVSNKLVETLEAKSREFFIEPQEKKQEIAMQKSKKAWRGYFKVGDELTSGKKDQKEGIYFGTEDEATDTRPLRGKNLWPDGDFLKSEVLEYMGLMKTLGHALLDAIDPSLHEHYKEEPTELFRIFNYPKPVPDDAKDDEVYGVGEHTDYGFLTILYQSQAGLQVKIEGEWVDVPPVPGTFVVNLGDALEHYTRGRLVATPHRVLYTGRLEEQTDRISFPYFFDPNWNAYMSPRPLVDGEILGKRQKERWDKADPRDFRGQYGEYLKRKISKVFPALFETALAGGP